MDKENLQYGGNDADVLARFMKEFFPFQELCKAGFFAKEIKGDYYAQAKRVCDFFGYNSVFEYGAAEVECHISYTGDRPESESAFMSRTDNIYT